MKSWRTILLLVVLAPVIAVEVWLFLIPDKYDARNARYVGWRFGLPTLDVEDALATMTRDSQRDTLVVGKSREELEGRFGFVSSLDQAPTNMKLCYAEHHKGEQVLFLRHSEWMVVMKDGHATGLFQSKDCL
jgi:hypothetical protein